MKKKSYKIYLPHLDYTIRVLDKSNGKDEEMKNFIAYTQATSDRETRIYMKLPLSKAGYRTLAHESVHALRNICAEYGMDFLHEVEHMAYILDLIFWEVTKNSRQ